MSNVLIEFFFSCFSDRDRAVEVAKDPGGAVRQALEGCDMSQIDLPEAVRQGAIDAGLPEDQVEQICGCMYQPAHSLMVPTGPSDGYRPPSLVHEGKPVPIEPCDGYGSRVIMRDGCHETYVPETYHPPTEITHECIEYSTCNTLITCYPTVPEVCQPICDERSYRDPYPREDHRDLCPCDDDGHIEYMPPEFDDIDDDMPPEHGDGPPDMHDDDMDDDDLMNLDDAMLPEELPVDEHGNLIPEHPETGLDDFGTGASGGSGDGDTTMPAVPHDAVDPGEYEAVAENDPLEPAEYVDPTVIDTPDEPNMDFGDDGSDGDGGGDGGDDEMGL